MIWPRKRKKRKRRFVKADWKPKDWNELFTKMIEIGFQFKKEGEKK